MGAALSRGRGYRRRSIKQRFPEDTRYPSPVHQHWYHGGRHHYILPLDVPLPPRRNGRRLLQPRWLTLFTAIAACFAHVASACAPAGPPPPAADSLRVYFLNVGQGDAALIITPDGVTALVDGGDRLRGAELVKWLRSMGLQKLDWVMPSHPHADHIAGLNLVLAELPVANALLSAQTNDTQTYRRQLDLLREKGVPVTDAVEGLTIPLGGRVTATVLNPPAGLLRTSEPEEDNSVVLRVCIAVTCMLFTGDIGDGGERSMIARYGTAADRIRSHVLKVSHHGSAEPNHPDFLAMVQPDVALIGVGLANPFRHPTQKALDRLGATGAAIYCTFVHGTLLVELTESSYRVQQLRDLTIRPTSGGRVVPAPPLSPEPCSAQ